MHGHDVGVLQSGEQDGLAPELTLRVEAGRGRRREHLERDGALELAVEGFVHAAHAARAELRADAVAAREDHSGPHLHRQQVLHAARVADQPVELLAHSLIGQRAGDAVGVGLVPVRDPCEVPRGEFDDLRRRLGGRAGSGVRNERSVTVAW